MNKLDEKFLDLLYAFFENFTLFFRFLLGLGLIFAFYSIFYALFGGLAADFIDPS